MVGWAFGVVCAFYMLLAMFAGRDTIVADRDSMNVRRQILGIGIIRRYPIAELRWLRFQPPMGRRRSHVAFECLGATVCFATDIDKAEAAHIIALLRQRYPIPGPARQIGVTLRRPDLEGLAALQSRRTGWVVLALLGVLLAMLVASMPPYVREMRSAKWPIVSGIIVDSHASSAKVGHSHEFALEIRYQYRVGGRQFTGSSIDFQPRDCLHSWEYAERMLTRYPAGKSVVVSYDPRNPGFAVLEASITSERQSLFYLGIGFIALVSIAFIYLLWLNLRSGPPIKPVVSATGADSHP